VSILSNTAEAQCCLPLKDIGGNASVNQRVEGVSSGLGAPDLVIRHKPSKSIVIYDIMVSFENYCNVKARKITKYSSLTEELQRQGYRVVVTAFVDALDFWDPRNEKVLRLLRIGALCAAVMRHFIVFDTIRKTYTWSTYPAVSSFFPSLWESSHDTQSGWPIVARRRKSRAGYGASRSEWCECYVSYFVF